MEFKKFCPTIRMLAHATSWSIDCTVYIRCKTRIIKFGMYSEVAAKIDDILVDRCYVHDDIKAIGILAPSCEWEKIHALAKEMGRWEETRDEEY